MVAEGKGRALAYRLGYRAGGGGEVQQLARAEDAATRVLEYSFLFDDKLTIWVVSGAMGELLCSQWHRRGYVAAEGAAYKRS